MSDNDSKYYAENGFVICQYCLKHFRQISTRHLKMHNMTKEDYAEKFPDAPVKKRKVELKIIEEKKLSTNTIIQNLINKKYVNENLEKNIPSYKINDILTKENILFILKKYFPNIQKNYIFKKLNSDGRIIYTMLADFGDPTRRTIFDFTHFSWHNKTPMYTVYRKKELLNLSKWKYINFAENILTIKNLKKELNNLK